MDALRGSLESVHPDTMKRRIVDAGKKRMEGAGEGARHELPLPGFSPSTPPEVAFKEYVSGSMGSAWPVDGAKNVGSKSASHNWSWDVYVVSQVNIINFGVARAPAIGRRR